LDFLYKAQYRNNEFKKHCFYSNHVITVAWFWFNSDLRCIVALLDKKLNGNYFAWWLQTSSKLIRMKSKKQPSEPENLEMDNSLSLELEQMHPKYTATFSLVWLVNWRL